MTEDPPSKRAREEEKDEEKEIVDCKIAAAQKLLSFNTDEITSTGLHDTVMFEKLQDFSTRLQTSLDAVKKVRDEEEMAMHDKKKKREEEEKTKLRMQLVAEKRCFKCNVVNEGQLNQCVVYKHKGGADGDGVLVCDKCQDDVTTHNCASCNSFLHDELQLKNSSCSECKDDSYTCKSCGEVVCLLCVVGEDQGRCCGGCLDWYCDNCDDDNIETKNCSMCDKEGEGCGNCSCDIIGECGNCDEPLCDGCVRQLACGNDIRLCGECDYDCEDCDMCNGYYTASRWA